VLEEVYGESDGEALRDGDIDNDHVNLSVPNSISVKSSDEPLCRTAPIHCPYYYDTSSAIRYVLN